MVDEATRKDQCGSLLELSARSSSSRSSSTRYGASAATGATPISRTDNPPRRSAMAHS
jgi:hypothetical protein